MNIAGTATIGRTSTRTRRAARPGLAALLLSVAAALGANGASAGEHGVCRDLSADGASYTACQFAVPGNDIRLFLTDPDGENWGSFSRLARALDDRGKNLTFAMNAGMYRPDHSPVGLYVEDGDKRRDLNLRRGPGNFHLLPNGVFYVTPTGAGVMESRRFQRFSGTVLHATQSGPMLVIDGELHPRFRRTSDSLKIRNGVGACAGGAITFAISNEPVNFHAFARLFRDTLDCRNALFLDGSVSALYAPSLARNDGWRPMGPIVGVIARKDQALRR